MDLFGFQVNKPYQILKLASRGNGHFANHVLWKILLFLKNTRKIFLFFKKTSEEYVVSQKPRKNIFYSSKILLRICCFSKILLGIWCFSKSLWKVSLFLKNPLKNIFYFPKILRKILCFSKKKKSFFLCHLEDCLVPPQFLLLPTSAHSWQVPLSPTMFLSQIELHVGALALICPSSTPENIFYIILWEHRRRYVLHQPIC